MKRLIVAVYVGLALLVLGPLLKSGYVLTLDMVFTPHIRLTDGNNSSYLFHLFLYICNFVVSSQIIEKLLLLAILVAAGVGAHRLVGLGEKRVLWGAYFAGVLYMVNPFTYSRLMGGQYLVLAGYALLPWFALALHCFSKRPGWGASLKLALWGTAISILSIHMVFFMGLLAVVLVAVAYARHNQRRYLKDWLKFGLIAVVIAVVASSYWLAPLVLGHSAEAHTIASFTSYDTYAFRTDAGKLSLPWNVLALSGFWGDRQSRYVLSWDQLGAWPVVMIAIGVLVLGGAIWSWRRQDHVGISLTIAGVLAAVLALGTAWGPVAPLNNWLIAHVPFFKGYREPEKFVALVVLAYAYLGGQTVNWLQRRVSVPRFAVIPLVLLPLLTAPTMLWAAGGQLRAVDYPSDWYAVNQRLDADHSHFKSLFLPWHLYLEFPFVGRVIANPAPRFFDTPVVAGDNAEVAPGEPQSARTRFVLDQLAPKGEQGQDVSGLLREQGYKYVIVAKTADYRRYDWLKTQTHIKELQDGPTLELFEVTHG